MKKIERNIPKMSDLPSFPEINKIINKLKINWKTNEKTLKKYICESTYFVKTYSKMQNTFRCLMKMFLKFFKFRDELTDVIHIQIFIVGFRWWLDLIMKVVSSLPLSDRVPTPKEYVKNLGKNSNKHRITGWLKNKKKAWAISR